METVQTAPVFAKRDLLQKTVLWERTKFLACLGKKDDSLRPDSALREKASRAVIWGGERVTESRDTPLMLPIHPLTINLSLKFQSGRIAKYIYIFELKEIYFTSIAKWLRHPVQCTLPGIRFKLVYALTSQVLLYLQPLLCIHSDLDSVKLNSVTRDGHSKS